MDVNKLYTTVTIEVKKTTGKQNAYYQECILLFKIWTDKWSKSIQHSGSSGFWQTHTGLTLKHIASLFNVFINQTKNTNNVAAKKKKGGGGIWNLLC